MIFQKMMKSTVHNEETSMATVAIYRNLEIYALHYITCHAKHMLLYSFDMLNVKACEVTKFLNFSWLKLK